MGKMRTIFLAVCVMVYFSTMSQASEGKEFSPDVLLKPLTAVNLSDYYHMPGTADPNGYQILHRKSTNKSYLDDKDAAKFVDQYCFKAKGLRADAEVLKFASKQVPDKTNKMILEMGVGLGRTINFLAGLNPRQPIYGFDSFEGLPTDWDKGNNRVIPKGTFAPKNAENPMYPICLNNVRLFKGLFKDVLPRFVQQVLKEAQIDFLHVDCDLYASTRDVFQALEKNILPGTIIAFDEFYNYPNYQQHEFKAFQEFLQKTGYEAEYLAYNIYHEQVVVRIKKRSGPVIIFQE